MSDIFISYAREDREWVGALAVALQARGWSVWWDSAIRTGETFSQVIEAALGSARCVIVVWSRHSVVSDWVLAEASEARGRGVLVPVLIDDARPPLVFRQLQTADFSGWEGDAGSAQFERLAADIASRMAAPSSSAEPGSQGTRSNRVMPTPKAESGRRRGATRNRLLAALVLIIVGGVAGGLIYLQQKNQAQVALVSDLVEASIEIRARLLKQNANGHTYWWSQLQHEGGVDMLQRSVLLAVEAMRRRPSVEAEKALRDGLVLLNPPIAEMSYESYGSSGLAFSPDGKYLAAPGRNNTARIWETTDWREIQRLRHQDRVRPVAFSPDGKTLATAADGIVRLWDVVSGEERLQIANAKMVRDLAFSPDGSRIAAAIDGSHLRDATIDATVRIWTLDDGREVQTIKHPSWDLRRAVFSLCWEQLVTIDREYTAHLWDVESAEELGTISPGKFADIAFSPDGKSLASASSSYPDSSASLWDLSTMKQLARMEHDRGALLSVTFSPGGEYLVSTGNDATARLWALPGGDEVFVVYHQGSVITAAFSADGAYLATGSRDGTARVWTVPDGEEVARLNNPGSVAAVQFSPDGKLVVTGSTGGYIRVWSLPIDEPLAEACRRVSRNLSEAEWQQYLGAEPYRKTCPEWP